MPNEAQDARMENRNCGRRSLSKTVSVVIKRKYTDTLNTKTFWNQVTGVLFISVVHNPGRKLKKIFVICWRIPIRLYS
jgi:hypothetical protein